MKSLFAAALIFGFLTLGFCDLNCWVGYANNGTLRGGSMPCDGGTCIHVNGSYSGQAVDLYACEPAGICDPATGHLTAAGFDAWCCNNADNCNAGGLTIPTPPSPAPSLPPPVVCYEGLYINNKNISRATATACFGNCASISANVSGNVFSVLTCDPLDLCNSLSLVNSCHVMPQNVLSGCCCNSTLCIDPVNNVMPPTPSPTPSGPTNPSLYCWVGYANNGTLRGGPIPCDGGTCVHVNGSYSGQAVDIFACEPMGLCTSTGNISYAGLDGYCCNDANYCNAKNFTIPPQTTPTPALPDPIVCNEGIYMNNKSISTTAQKLCYGSCASVTANLGSTNFSVLTCDPLTLCDNLGLINSCHTMPAQVLSGCCCNTNRCIDPVNNVIPTPPVPPPGSIKCFIGLQMGNQMPVGSETYCPGMCHSTSTMLGTTNYTVYACSRGTCELFGIRPNSCGSEEGALQSCCCDSDNCNTPSGFTPPTVDPNPPNQAERCFIGFQTTNLGPLGRSTDCLGDCVTYSAGGLKIFSCDPISVCNQLNATNGNGSFGLLNVSCCSTRDCNYQPSTTVTSCYNGITLIAPGYNYSKAQSLQCMGRCATYSVQYKNFNVFVHACDPYNLCSTAATDILKVSCCDTPNCNLDNGGIPVTTVAPVGRKFSCFQGFQLRRGFAFGNEMSCDGACARVHVGDDTIYTCDPGDTCGDFGVDGCNMLFEGFTVCCCKGRMCNAPEVRMRPAIKQNLNCFVGYGFGTAVTGGQLPCNGMCGKLTTTINNTTLDAYLCLDQPLCEDRDAYERCSRLQTDMAVKVCCCGGYDHCNYEPMNSTVLPPPSYDNNVTCPQGLFVNGYNVYHTGNTIVTCPNSCGLIQFNTTVNQRAVNFAYYGCDPVAFCNKFDTVNSCGSLGNSISGCCCDSDLCMNPIVGKMIPNTASSLSCWVGYNYNNSLEGGSVPCDGGSCVHVNGTYSNQTVDVFACEPIGICNDGNHLNVPGLDAWCCIDSDNCNAAGYTIPPPPSPAPTLPNPIICNEGLYMNNKSISQMSKKICYGMCASVVLTMSNTTTFTVATCDPLTLCNKLNLKNSCHVMPQQVLSGCCCDSNLCIDPSTGNATATVAPPNTDTTTPKGSATANTLSAIILLTISLLFL